MKNILKSLLLFTVFTLGCAPALALEGAIGIHDPSTVIKCDGNYYVYGTGRGISVLTSSNGFDWQRGQKIFDRIPDSVKSFVPKNDGQSVWAPDIINLNGQFYLYYAISSWGQYVSAVGLLTSPTLDPGKPDYKWTDCGMVVHSGEGENLNAIDPGVIHAPDGTLWICYGSYHGNIELVQLDPKTGLRIATNSPVTVIADESEASDIIYHGGYYYLFVNHNGCCQGTNSTYNIRVGRSQKITGPYFDRYGDPMTEGGGTLFLASEGRDIGPGHFGLLVDDGVEKFSCHYEAELGRNGRSILDIRPLLWTVDGWPMPGENVRDGTYQIRSQRTGTILQASTNAAANSVQTGRYLVRDNQKWNITIAGGGFYKITSAMGENVLTAADETADVAPFSGADNQLWKIDQLADGSYRIASKTGKLALTAAFKTRPGNGIALQPFTGDDAQRWVITAP
ncbi:MAG TPA: family 43 glycosylhydrolase [Verrucomicrobiae bacterium]|jgi:arabinan endo-1,5-alpha-L-arabinosidase